MIRRALCGLVLMAVWVGPYAMTVSGATLSGQVAIWEASLIGGKDFLDDRSNAVVFVAGFSEPPPEGVVPELPQKDKSFTTRVLAITAGQEVAFPNLDPWHHNVWSKSKARPFDLGLYEYPQSKRVDFPRPGIVTVFCNIHPEMIATILVLPNRRYAVTEPDGSYRIEGVPAGTWPVFAWVEGATPVKRMVRFGEDGTLSEDFELHLQRIPVDHLNKEGKPYKKQEGRKYNMNG